MIIIKNSQFKQPFTLNKQSLIPYFENTQKHEPMTQPKGIVLHWGANNRFNWADGYHYNICDFSGVAVVVQSLKLSEKGSHVWGRNSGLIGISMSCMAKPDLIPTDLQKETTSILVAEFCAWKSLDIFGKIILPEKKYYPKPDRLIDTGKMIKFPVVTDHAEYAKRDGYFPSRWDIGSYKTDIVDRAKVIYSELKSGKGRKFQFLEILK